MKTNKILSLFSNAKRPENQDVASASSKLLLAYSNPVSVTDIRLKHDQYGFIVEHSISKTEKEVRLERKRKAKEEKLSSRLRKKLDCISNKTMNGVLIENIVQSSKIFKMSSYAGYPLEMRGEIWQKLADVESFKIRNIDTYQKMVNYGLKNSSFIAQIDADVHRTFRNHVLFYTKYSESQCRLFNILVAYSVFNSSLGYAQGMNTLTAVLLMHINDEETCFWILHSLMVNEKYQHHGFLAPGFPKYPRFEKHFETLLQSQSKQLSMCFVKQGIISSCFLTKWLFLLFLEALPFSLCVRFFDVYLFKGQVVLLPFAIAILKYFSTTLLSYDMEQTTDFLLNRVPKLSDFNEEKLFKDFVKLMKVCKKKNISLPKEVQSKEEKPEECGKVANEAIIMLFEDVEDDSFNESEFMKIENEGAETNGIAKNLNPEKYIQKIHSMNSLVSETANKIQITDKISHKFNKLPGISLKDTTNKTLSGIERSFEKSLQKPGELTKRFESLTKDSRNNREKQLRANSQPKIVLEQNSEDENTEDIKIKHHLPSSTNELFYSELTTSGENWATANVGDMFTLQTASVKTYHRSTPGIQSCFHNADEPPEHVKITITSSQSSHVLSENALVEYRNLDLDKEAETTRNNEKVMTETTGNNEKVMTETEEYSIEDFVEAPENGLQDVTEETDSPEESITGGQLVEEEDRLKIESSLEDESLPICDVTEIIVDHPQTDNTEICTESLIANTTLSVLGGGKISSIKETSSLDRRKMNLDFDSSSIEQCLQMKSSSEILKNKALSLSNLTNLFQHHVLDPNWGPKVKLKHEKLLPDNETILTLLRKCQNIATFEELIVRIHKTEDDESKNKSLVPTNSIKLLDQSSYV